MDKKIFTGQDERIKLLELLENTTTMTLLQTSKYNED